MPLEIIEDEREFEIKFENKELSKTKEKAKDKEKNNEYKNANIFDRTLERLRNYRRRTETKPLLTSKPTSHSDAQEHNNEENATKNLEGTEEESAEALERYEFDANATPLYESRTCKLVKCYDKKSPKLSLVAQIYNNSSWIRDEKQFVTLLKRLSSPNIEESPHILAVHRSFFSENNKFIIIQEHAHYGSSVDYILKYGHAHITEEMIRSWARNIYRAMEYLKEINVAHRNICPSSVMLVAGSPGNLFGTGEIEAKLWGFRSAITLSSEHSLVMQLQLCWMFSRTSMFNFQAPEVFYNDRSSYYDALDADIWSYAATFLFLSTGNYPYPVLEMRKFTDPELEQAIEETIEGSKISEEAREFFAALLVANPRKRMDFRRIAYLNWLSMNVVELTS